MNNIPRDEALVERASQFHPWDAMAPAALAAILKRGPFRRSAETGCGGSTIVLSQVSERHTAFAIEGENRTITGLRNHLDLVGDRVTFVEGESKDTVPVWQCDGELDLVLLDGPHAYPWPQVEFAYLFPKLRMGGWLVVDDIQIPSVHELFRFLKRESQVTLEEVVVRTAFFRRVSLDSTGPDGWERQGINRSTIWRYSWRDRMRKWLGPSRREDRPRTRTPHRTGWRQVRPEPAR
jgi:precorrin-6B methylase 2